MKRKIFYIMLICVLCLCSCKNNEPDYLSEERRGDPSAFVIKVNSICVRNKFGVVEEKMLDENEVKAVLSILNSGGWEWGRYKLSCSHNFIMDDEKIWYDTSGIILDNKRDRMLKVSEEQKYYLNSIVPRTAS